MKWLYLVSLAGTAGAFSTRPRRSTTTSLQMASTSLPPKLPEWSEKPILRKGEKKTTPVASERKLSMAQIRKMGDVMIDPDYFLTWAVALLCPLIIWYHPTFGEGPSLIGVAGGCFHLLFAALLWVQTRRVRCVFEKDGFEFYNIKGPKLDLDNGAWLERKPDNYVAGTVNRWKYDQIINYGFFPSEVFPVICYFKETETPEEQWDKWFAAFDSYGGGQPHFFPGICNARQFKEQMELRGVKRKGVPTLKDAKSQK
jgi:hypothetical protein